MRLIGIVAGWAMFIGGCRSASGKPDPATLLHKLAAARTVEQRLTALDELSAVHLDDPAAHAADLLPAVRPLLLVDDVAIAAKAGELLASWNDRDATPGLLRLLQRPDPVIRLSAAASLTRLRDPGAAGALIAATGDADGTVRAQACTALGALGLHDTSIGTALSGRLDDPDAAVRAAAARALAASGSAADVPLLITLLGARQPGVASAAAEALGGVGDRRAVAPLLAAARSGQPEVRRAAAAALGNLGDAAAVPVLVEQLSDADTDLRATALNALGAIGDATALPGVIAIAADADPTMHRRLPHVLGRLYVPSALGAFQAKLHDPDPNARSAAALALGLAYERRAAPELIGLLADSDAHVRLNAASALGLLEVPTSVERLQRLRDEDPDSWVRAAANEALMRLVAANQ